MLSQRVQWLRPLFIASGACGLLYQIVWTRQAFASFGVVTPVLSVVVSVFMFGLAVGSWLAGRWIGPLVRRTGVSPALCYAALEIGIGVGAWMVPRLFLVGESLLLSAGEMNSGTYLLWSAAILAGALWPWCVLMGATTPVALAFLREEAHPSPSAFSSLYFANVIGAFLGTVLTAGVLIETLGFSQTLTFAGCVNFAIAAVAVAAAIRFRGSASAAREENAAPIENPAPSAPRLVTALLFATGFGSMALEVVWTRAFTPVLMTSVYAFSGLLAVYLLATWVGSAVYRSQWKRGRAATTGTLLGLLALTALFPILLGDPRLHDMASSEVWWHANVKAAALVLGSIAPFCAVLGYLTPKLIDEVSRGRPQVAGRAYAVNTFGCILGPLAASYVMLPAMGVKAAMLLLMLPFALAFLTRLGSRPASAPLRAALAVAVWLVGLPLALWCESYEEAAAHDRALVRRDATATVVAAGTGFDKILWVNGTSITSLTPITKVMAHLPCAAMPRKPESALVICLGMGTTFRSLGSWGIDVTAVELVPSVRDFFPYFFDDAEALLARGNARIVVDDGRRYLKRTAQQFDVITLDPPPPVEAAGSSLLYSKEFYDLVLERLAPDGILQQWFPGGDPEVAMAVTRAVASRFPYFATYASCEGWGFHVLASRQPIAELTVDAFLERLPPAARADLMEFTPHLKPEPFAARILSGRQDPSLLLAKYPDVTVCDDRPFNEYFLLRQIGKIRRGEPVFRQVWQRPGESP